MTGEKSNAALQADIAKYGLDKFTAYIFEEVDLSSISGLNDKRDYLRLVEQRYMDQFHTEQLYNSIRSRR